MASTKVRILNTFAVQSSAERRYCYVKSSVPQSVCDVAVPWWYSWEFLEI